MSNFLYNCYQAFFNCLYPSDNLNTDRIQIPSNDVKLDSTNMGQEAVIVKDGSRLCGSGAAIASTAINQNKAYWEIKVQQSGIWSCGLANTTCDLNSPMGGQSNNSWVITSDNSIQTASLKETLDQVFIQEGDIIGMSYDHIELNFYHNGVNLNKPILGIKGTVYPVLYVDDGAILDVEFERFYNDPPPGFDKIMVEKALL